MDQCTSILFNSYNSSSTKTMSKGALNSASSEYAAESLRDQSCANIHVADIQETGIQNRIPTSSGNITPTYIQ